ncbi:MAG TPA: MarR family winged helix-turn-helix transcriptional regulator [Planctomycetota bacterium]|nr:MarR family winged helix-turn-helix transcriptional regulator [Planctomycetota bacterium]
MRKTKANDSSQTSPESLEGLEEGSALPPENVPLDDPSRRRLPPLLRRAWYSLNQAFRRRIAYSGLTPDQFTILRLLTESPPEGLTQRELAVLMSSDPNTIASLLDRMQAAKLLERRPHESDRRAHRVKLLQKGKTVHAELRDIAIKLQSEVLTALPPERREQFLADLEAVAIACQAGAKAPLPAPQAEK